MPVEVAGGAAELRAALAAAARAGCAVLVDFYATWCGPCRALAPVLAQMETENGGRLEVLKVDCEASAANRALAAAEAISAFPTLQLYGVDGAKAQTFRGASPPALRAAVAAALAAAPRPAASPTAAAAALGVALGRLEAGCAAGAEFAAAARTLLAYTTNALEKPEEPRFRRVKASNAAFAARVGRRAGGRAAMEALGFAPRVEAMEELFVMERVDAPALRAMQAILERALERAERGGAAAPTPVAAAAEAAPAAVPAPAVAAAAGAAAPDPAALALILAELFKQGAPPGGGSA
jgi:thioredoxin 1